MVARGYNDMKFCIVHLLLWPVQLLGTTRTTAMAITTTLPRWLGSAVVGHRTCDREVAGSTPGCCIIRATTLGKLFTPNVPLFAKQYNLVPCEGLHAKAPYCGSGIGSNEQGEYCRAVFK